MPVRSTHLPPLSLPSRRDPAVASILRSWRELTAPAGSGGRGPPSRRTLIACSGGCDSSALLLALASASQDLVVAHILHDIRPRAEATLDRDAAAHLAESLNLPFAETEVSVFTTPGNLEARARRARYRALAQLAAQHHCPYIATAHHADDQLETVLMALLRGSGPRGLRGVARSRPLRTTPSIRIIRPMLGTIDGRARPLTRADCERLCTAANWAWRNDATNTDQSYLRNALRARVLPILKDLRPRAAERFAAAAAIQHDLARLQDQAVESLTAQLALARTQVRTPPPHPTAWPRPLLAQQPPSLITALLQRELRPTARPDRLTGRVLGPVVRAITDRSTDPRTFQLANDLTIHIQANWVWPSSGVPLSPLPEGGG